MLCLSSRIMIDKTMCEVLWRNIFDFSVNLRVEVAAVSRNRYDVEKTVDTHTLLINTIQFYVCLQEIWDKTMCEVSRWNISDFYVNLRVEVGKPPQVILVVHSTYAYILKNIYKNVRKIVGIGWIG